MHGEHPTRRIRLLIHASPRACKAAYEEGSRVGKHVKYVRLSSIRPWADCRHTHSPARLGIVGPVKAQSNLRYATFHLDARMPLPTPEAKSHTHCSRSGRKRISKMAQINVNVIRFISV